MSSWLWNWTPWINPPPPSTTLDRARAHIRSYDPLKLVVNVFAAGLVTSLGLGAYYKRFLKRIPTAGYVTPNMITGRRVIKGVVTRFASQTRPRDGGADFE